MIGGKRAKACRKHRAALESITLRFDPGSATAIMGPDGVGKSTLLGLIAGVRRLQSGVIRVLGGGMDSGTHRNRISQRIAPQPRINQ